MNEQVTLNQILYYIFLLKFSLKKKKKSYRISSGAISAKKGKF